MYIIDKVTAEYMPMNDQHVYSIWYRDDVGKSCGLNIAVSAWELSKAYAPEEHLIEKVATYDPKLYEPMRKHMDQHFNYPPKMKYDWKVIGTLDEGGMAKIKDSIISKYEHKTHVHEDPLQYNNGGILFPGPVTHTSNSEDAGVAALPGLDERVKHPNIEGASCDIVNGTVKHLVMHLNDYHKWTREQIADWLETLDVDLRFKSPDDRLREAQIKSINAKMNAAKESIAQWQKCLENAKIDMKSLMEQLNKLQEEQNEQAG